MSKKLILFIIIAFSISLVLPFNVNLVSADSLTDSINEQLEHIDLSELEDFFNNIDKDNGETFSEKFNNLVNGNFNFELNNLIDYVVELLFSKIRDLLPTFLTIIAISIFCGLLDDFKANFIAEGVSEIISFIGLLSIILLISSELIMIFENAKITMKNLANLNNIMSPIILTLMLAVGGNVSATVYKPVVVIFSNAIINVVLGFLFPLIGMLLILGIISNFSNSIKLNKSLELISSIIKWVLGVTCTIFGVFISVQGITSASYDGISIKATKYALSSGIPIVGGFIKDGFDLVVAGSILIKNTVGIISVISMIFIIISPILLTLAFSFLLKAVSAVIEPLCDKRIIGTLSTISKGINFLIACIAVVSLMFFINVLLLLFSANCFI